MKFESALRDEAKSRIELIDKADLVVGIPSFNNQTTIPHVIEQVSTGLSTFFPGKKSLIILSDGGSVDDSREEAENVAVHPGQEKMVTIYRGVPGKGSAIRAILEVAEFLNAEACVVVDSDLRSICPEWIWNLLSPVINEGYQYVTPYYKRYKFDGTITNNIVYNMTRALYGKRVRQPIGGDFAMGGDLVDSLCDQDVWDTDVARFGIDIWMTTTALVNEFPICQARLGAKIHDVKDPGDHLGPMFRQVVSTLFSLMEKNAPYWITVNSSENVPITGDEMDTEPEAFPINVGGLVRSFKQGYFQFSDLWERILSEESYRMVEELSKKDEDKFGMDVERWAHILYDAATTYHFWDNDRSKLVELLTPLYYARVASFAKKAEGMNDEEAEGEIEAQARCFEKEKPYLIERWQACEEYTRST